MTHCWSMTCHDYVQCTIEAFQLSCAPDELLSNRSIYYSIKSPQTQPMRKYIYIYAMLYHPIFMIQWLVQKLTTQTRFRRGENWLYKWEKIDFFLIPFRFSLNTNFLRAFTNSSENKWTNRMRRISISCSFELFWFTYYYVKNRVQMKYNLDKLIIVFVMSTQVVDNKMTRNR